MTDRLTDRHKTFAFRGLLSEPKSQEMKKIFPILVDGGWGLWEEWSDCSSCEQTRTRQCNNPAPANDGLTCSGKNTEEQSCGNCQKGDIKEWGEVKFKNLTLFPSP